MTTSVLIVNRGPLDVVTESNGIRRVLRKGEFTDVATWHDGQPITITIIEVKPAEKGASTPT